MSKSVVARIESALNSTNATLQTCLSIKNARQILTGLASAQIVLDNSLEAIPKRSKAFTPVKKSLVALSNAVGSLHSGVESRDLSLAEFRDSLIQVQEKFLAQALASIGQVALGDDLEKSSNSTEFKDKLVVRSTDLKSALQVVKQRLGHGLKQKAEEEDAENPVLVEHLRSEKSYRDREEKEEALLKARLEHVQSLKTRIPVKIKGAYQLLRLPLVPIFDSGVLSGKKPSGRSNLTRNFSNSRLLDSLGLKHIMVQDYLILEEQFVLAVDLADAKEFMAKEKGRDNSAYKEELENYKKKQAEFDLLSERLAKREQEEARLKEEKDRAEKSLVEAKAMRLLKMDPQTRMTKLAELPVSKRVHLFDSIDQDIRGKLLAGLPKDSRKEMLSEDAKYRSAKKQEEANLPRPTGSLTQPRLQAPERPRRRRAEVTPVDFAKSIIEVLNEKAPSKYTLVTDQGILNPRNKDIMFYWVMPRKTLSALIQKGWSKVKTWGFPW